MGCYVGEWRVGSEIFRNKSMALLRATELGADVSYHYYDDIFSSVDRSLLGKIPLSVLYKERAQQLRDKYDHLILYYSGGADSRNILMTFLSNDIKLDTVMVKWPFKAVGKNIYPITNDPDSINYMCEWDLVIKPDLEWLRRKHPEITIELVDWLEDASDRSFMDRSFDDLHQFTYMSNILRVPSSSQIEKTLANKGKKVASIYGVDKPVFWLSSDNTFHFLFNDTATTVNPPRDHNPSGAEYFYWTPDMPIIVYEQCYQLMKWFERNRRYRDLARPMPTSLLSKEEINKRWMKQLEITKSVIYPTTNRIIFQADKPLRSKENFIGVTKDFYLETHPELYKMKAAWKYHWNSWMQQIDPRFHDDRGWFHPIRSRPFYVGRFDE